MHCILPAFGWGPNSFSWASTGSGCWKRKIYIFKKMMPISCSKIYRTCFSHGNLSYLNYIQDDYSVEAPGFQDKNIKLNESSMIIFHDWNRFIKLVDFRTNTWKLNESCQSLYHQSLDIKRYDEVWWGKVRVGRQKGLFAHKAPDSLQPEKKRSSRIQHTWSWNGMDLEWIHFFKINNSNVFFLA